MLRRCSVTVRFTAISLSGISLILYIYLYIYNIRSIIEPQLIAFLTVTLKPVTPIVPKGAFWWRLRYKSKEEVLLNGAPLLSSR